MRACALNSGEVSLCFGTRIGNMKGIPLTPTLSRRERGQPSARLKLSRAQGFGDRLTPFLPLPSGEGRGEGTRLLERYMPSSTGPKGAS